MASTLTIESFNFDHMSDVELCETFDLWAPGNEPSAAWTELYALGRAAIIEEAHRRALAVTRRFVTITCGTEHIRDDQMVTGTTEEFLEAFGITADMINQELKADQGSITGVGSCGHRVVLDWEIT